MSEEKLVLEGKRIKLMTQERAVRADAGVIIDYLRFTVTRDALIRAHLPAKGNLIIDGLQNDQEITEDLACYWARLLGFQPGEARAGRDFYDHTFTVVDADGHEVGSVSGGGEGQRGTFCLSLKGYGCNFARHGWERRVYDVFSAMGATITRIDLARDFFNGERGYHDAENAYRAGGFSYRGRAPSVYQHGDFEHGQARTFQVGKRDSGKLFRGYEKGHQFTLMDDPWWRAEVELRNHNRVIPFETLIRPAAFFAGAYAFCAELLEQVEPVAIPTGEKVIDVSVERTVRWLERTVAPAIVTLSLADGFDWLTRLAVEHAHRPRPRGLKGLSTESLQAGIRRALTKFKHTSPAPAGSMASLLPA